MQKGANINRIKAVLAEQNRTSKWLAIDSEFKTSMPNFGINKGIMNNTDPDGQGMEENELF